MRSIVRALWLLSVLTVLTGILVPLVVTLVACVVFPHEASGSRCEHDGRIVGSELLAQSLTDPRWFWSRPSATTPPWNPAASSASNLGPSNPAWIDTVSGRIDALRAADPGTAAPVPIDLVTTSASGLDPHVSPAAALHQVARVARARGLAVERVRELVLEHVEGRTFGILGEPRVHVLRLNLALESLR